MKILGLDYKALRSSGLCPLLDILIAQHGKKRGSLELTQKRFSLSSPLCCVFLLLLELVAGSYLINPGWLPGDLWALWIYIATIACLWSGVSAVSAGLFLKKFARAAGTVIAFFLTQNISVSWDFTEDKKFVPLTHGSVFRSIRKILIALAKAEWCAREYDPECEDVTYWNRQYKKFHKAVEVCGFEVGPYTEYYRQARQEIDKEKAAREVGLA